MMQERGLTIDHPTIDRWVPCSAPERRTETRKGSLYGTTSGVPGGYRAQARPGTDPHRDDGRASASCPTRPAADLCRLWQSGHDQPAQGLLYQGEVERLYVRMRSFQSGLGSRRDDLFPLSPLEKPSPRCACRIFPDHPRSDGTSLPVAVPERTWLWPVERCADVGFACPGPGI